VSIRGIAKSTGIYSVAVFAGRMSSFVLLPVYTRYLTPRDYGVLELLELTMYVFGTMVGMRLGEALLYHYSHAKDERGRQSVLGTAFLGAAALGTLLGALGILLSPWLSALVFRSADYVDFFRLMFLAFVLSLPQEVALSYMRARDRAGHYAAASLAKLAISAAANLTFLVGLGWGITGMLWGGLVSAAAQTVILAAYCLRDGLAWDGSLWRPMIRYGAPLGAGGLGFLVIHYGDRFYLQRHMTLDEIGIYSLAYKIGMLITYLQTPFDIYWRAQMFSLVRGPGGEKIYVRVCTYLTAGLCWVLLFLAVLSEPVLRVMAGRSFGDAAPYIPWVAAAYVLRTIGSHFRCAFLLEGRTHREAAVVWAGALVCLAAYSLLIPRYTLWGAVAATLLAFVVMFVMGLVQAQKVRHFPFEFGRMGYCGAVAAGLWAAFAQIRPEGPWPQALAGLGFVLSYPALLLAGGFFAADEKEALRRLMRSGFRLFRQPAPVAR
jgi:O-antigen/teichoic acid export membrane protein